MSFTQKKKHHVGKTGLLLLLAMFCIFMPAKAHAATANPAETERETKETALSEENTGQQTNGTVSPEDNSGQQTDPSVPQKDSAPLQQLNETNSTLEDEFSTDPAAEIK